jgi:predicted Zn finger-like uncharacterized protein
MFEKECKNCGAIYQIIAQDYPMRDKDSIKCEYCGDILLSWNGGIIYSSKNVTGPTRAKYNKLS